MPLFTGDSSEGKNRTAILVPYLGARQNLGEGQAVDVIYHEWAHAPAWNYLLDRRTERYAGLAMVGQGNLVSVVDRLAHFGVS